MTPGGVYLFIEKPGVQPTDAVVHPGEDLVVGGWAYASQGIDRIRVLLNGQDVASVSARVAREDVMAAMGGREDALRSGFEARVRRRELPAGQHFVEVVALAEGGASQVARFVVHVSPAKRAAKPLRIAGKAVVRKKFVLLVDGEMLATRAAIDELAETLRDESVGIAVPKVLDREGRLAGAGEDPDHPDCCYARRLDFGSIASMIRMDLWRKVRASSLADLGLRVRQLGYEVRYQPFSVLTRSNVSAVRKRQLAVRRRAKRALFIDAVTPTPDQDAGSNVIVEHMRILQSLGYDVTFAPSDNLCFAGRYTEALQREGIEAIYQPYLNSLEDLLRARGGDFNLAYVHRFAVGEVAIDPLRRLAPRARILFNNADLHYLRMEREAAIGASATPRESAWHIKARELAVIKSADCTILCNTVEQHLLAKELPRANFHYLPWVVGARSRAPNDFARRKGIMFLGGFGHRPNVDAMKHFVAHVMPLLRKRLPRVRLHVYGSKMPAEIEALAASDVVVEGFAPDLDAVFKRHRLSVVPLRFGAGFKGKLATSLGQGVPAVASPIAIEGTGLADGDGVLVADSPAAFADAIARAYRNRALWLQLSKAGLSYVRQHYSFERGQEHFRAIIASIS